MTRDEKLAAIKAEREANSRTTAENRAASDESYDFTNRPDAPPADDNCIILVATAASD